MGYATIVSGGSHGRYTVLLDYGEAYRAGALAALDAKLARLEVAIAEAQERVSVADDKEAAQRLKIEAAINTFLETHREWPAGSAKPDDSGVRFEIGKLRQLQTVNAPKRTVLSALKMERTETQRMVAAWNAAVLSETKQVWCTDYTEDAAPGQIVATMDIPGESDLVVLAPGCRGWAASDGVMTAREVMSPEQVFFNAAILPGWQIDKPTYRWGTITAIDYQADTIDVSLGSATSSAQRLDVNREDGLALVPINYMDSGAAIFEVGDRVVIRFDGGDWETPRAMGFLDNPRPANWTAVGVDASTNSVLFKSRVADVLSALLSGVVDAKFRFEEPIGSLTSWASFTTVESITGGKRWIHEFVMGVDIEGSPRMGAIVASIYNPHPTYSVPLLVVQASPSWPPSSSNSTHRIAEVALYVGGELLANVAATDGGWLGSPIDNDYKARTKGGYRNEIGDASVAKLTTHRLISEGG